MTRAPKPRLLPTVADLRAAKGRRQLTMLRYFSLDEAAAAEAAGIDIASVPAEIVLDPRYRQAAPSVFSMTGLTHLQAGSADDYLRWSGDAINRGADAVYCSGSLRTVEHLAREPRNRPTDPCTAPANRPISSAAVRPATTLSTPT